jgi:K+-dependent Na+/Ca+ exchanger-like protein
VDFFLSIFLLGLSFVVIAVITEKRFIPSLENIARWLKMPESVAGATLLAFGSSAPELFTSLLTLVVLRDQPAFGVGNVIGSALFQILVVIGFAATIKTTYLHWQPVLRDGFVYGLAVLLLFLFVRDGVFTVLEGAILVGSYLLYLGLLLSWRRLPAAAGEKKAASSKAADEGGDHSRFPGQAALFRPVELLLGVIPDPRKRPAWTLPVFCLSVLVVGAGSYILVRAGIHLARLLQVDPAIVALTIIAGGSSVPELVSSAVVARQGKGDMAIANALGSNTFDIFISLGLPVLVSTLLYGNVEQVGGVNITASIILLFATLIMVLGLLAMQKFKASRLFGLLLILAYLVYVVAVFKGWVGADVVG